MSERNQLGTSRPIGRRSFLALGALGLLAFVQGCSNAYRGQALNLWVQEPPARYTGTSFRPRPAIIKGFTIYSASPSEIDLGTWRLRVDGLVSHPLEHNIQDILALEPVVLTSNFQCGDGWIVRSVRWQGIRLKTLLDAAGVAPGARSVNLFSMDGRYASTLSLNSARSPSVLLAYGANNEPLARDQGYPLRLVVPRMFGYRSVKWVNRIEVSAQEHQDLFENKGNDLALWTR